MTEPGYKRVKEPNTFEERHLFPVIRKMMMQQINYLRGEYKGYGFLIHKKAEEKQDEKRKIENNQGNDPNCRKDRL